MRKREKELCDAIAASPDDPACYLAYGDYLRASGHARAQLITVDEESDRRPEHRRSLQRDRKRILSASGAELLGPLAKSNDPSLALRWRFGFIASARVSQPSERWWDLDPRPVVERLLASPSAVFLQQLSVFCHPRFHPELSGLIYTKGPKTLKTLHLAKRHTSLEEALQNPREVSWLWLDLPAEQIAMPPRFFTLGALERLELSAPSLRELPGQLGWLSSLVELELCVCPRLRALPDTLFGLCSLSRIGGEAFMRTGQLSRALNQLLRDLTAARVPSSQRQIECALLLGQAQRVHDLASDEQLIAALDSQVAEVRQNALHTLKERNAHSEKVRVPLGNGAKVVLRGVAPGVRALAREVLPGMGVEIQRRPDRATTHVVVGSHGAGAQALAATTAAELVVESDLQRLLKVGVGPLPRHSEDVLGTWLGGDAAAVGKALSVMELSGFPPELAIDLLVASYDAQLGPSLRQRIRRLLDAEAPVVAQAARKHLGRNLMRCSEGRLAQKIDEFAAESETDGVLLARLLLGRLRRGGKYLLEGDGALSARWVLDELLHDGVLDLAAHGLVQLPAVLAELEGVRCLDLSDNPFARLPAVVCTLGQLRELVLDGCPRLKTLPDSLAGLRRLRTLRFANNRLTRFPLVLTTLAQLEALDLDGEAGAAPLREISVHIGALRRLRSLGLGYGAFKTLPEGLFRLFALEELRLTGATLPPVPASIAQLVLLRKLVVSGSSWDDAESRGRLQTLLPQCSIR